MEFHKASWPSMQEQHRHNSNTPSPLNYVNKVYVQALNVHFVLEIFVDILFSFDEVVFVFPEVDDFFKVLPVEAILECNIFQGLSIPGGFVQPLFQLCDSLKKQTMYNLNSGITYAVCVHFSLTVCKM